MTDVDLTNFSVMRAARIFSWCVENNFGGAVQRYLEMEKYGFNPITELYKFQLTDHEATMLMLRWSGDSD